MRPPGVFVASVTVQPRNASDFPSRTLHRAGGWSGPAEARERGSATTSVTSEASSRSIRQWSVVEKTRNELALRRKSNIRDSVTYKRKREERGDFAVI